MDLAAERARLESELNEVHTHIQRLEQLLASPFSEKAPAEVVDKERARLEAYRQTAEKLNQQLKELG